MYIVVGCSECESVKITETDNDSTVCNRCRNRIDVGKARTIYRSRDLEKAKEARSVALARRNGFTDLASEIVEDEVVDENVGEEITEKVKATTPETPEIEEVSKKSSQDIVDAGREMEGGVIDEEEYAEEKGVDTGELDKVSEVGRGKTASESKPQKRIVRDAVEFLDEPTDDEVIDFAVERGVDSQRAVEIVDKMCMEGEAMRKRNGGIRLL